MKAREMIEKLNLVCKTGESGLDNDVRGVYCCDLLSWVMSHASKGNVWITVQVHPNIVAVASLLELSCIIIPENIEIESITIERAMENNIPVLQSGLNGAELCCSLKDLGA